ncbi:MAG: hypothetical protein M3P08_16025 [Thermoproteota archaeon]|nr:hypothetical protein [Thermoproteota archaeon]
MTPIEFEQFLKFSKDRISEKSNSEKIRAFIEWCKEKDMEEIILRLSSEDKGGWGKNCFLDFSTTRMIVSKKSFVRKFADLGYIAGMAPFPYKLTTKNWNVLKGSDITERALISPEDVLTRNSSNFYIWYSDIEEFVVRKGVETIMRNMLGTMIKANFLTIKESHKTYNFAVPVNKNGSFDEIHFWLSVVLPVNVSALR